MTPESQPAAVVRPLSAWARTLAPLLLVISGALVYCGTLGAPFIYDDHNAIVNNPHIRSLLPLSSSLSAPDQSTVAGRPVAALSLALNYAISQLEPWSYHLLNIAIHLLAGLALYGVLWRTMLSPGLPQARGLPVHGLALTMAALWLVHPLNTEVVTYVSTRTESLMALMALVALYALIRSASSARAGAWWAVCVVATALAMACKEVAVSLPLLLFAFDAVFLAEGWRDAWQRRRWLHLGLAATWGILVALIARGVRSETVGLFFPELGPLTYLQTQVGVIWHYLRLAIWPHPLALDYYDWPVAHHMTAELALGMLLLGGMVVSSLWLLWRRSWLGYVGFWFFAILAPTSSLVPIISEVAAERRMYLPLAAVIVLVAIATLKALDRLTPSRSTPVAAGLAVVVLVGLGVGAFKRNQVYGDELTIWRDTVHTRPGNGRARQNLGAVLAKLGRRDEAVVELEKALELDPNGTDAPENLALIRLDEGKPREAAALLERLAALRPDDGTTRLNLAKALLDGGDVERAITVQTEAVRLLPSNAVAQARLAWLLAEHDRAQEAGTYAEQALRLEPESAAVQLLAAQVFLRRGDTEASIKHFQATLRLDPTAVDARLGLAVALRRAGHAQESRAALAQLAREVAVAAQLLSLAELAETWGESDIGGELLGLAVERDPANPTLRLAVARALAASKQDAAALAHFREALRLRPGWGDAGNSLAVLLATAEDPAVRNPPEALAIAKALAAASGNRHPVTLSTLAIALASAGRRSEAEQVLSQAVAIARQAGQSALVQHLEQYQAMVKEGWPEPPG